MNRIQHLAAGESSSTDDHGSIAVEINREQRCEHDAPHTFFSPLHYERNYAYPLIVWLHGPEDDERQLKRVLPLVSTRNYVAVAPRGTVVCEDEDSAERELEPALRGFAWSQSADQILLGEHRVFAAIGAAQRRFNVASSRIFLAGFSCGGTMALRLALAHPTFFAGAASFGGAFPTGMAPLGRLAEARKLKLLLATGRDSIDYPPERVCDHLRLFHVAGMSVCLRQYPCADDLTTSMLSDLDRWIMDQFIAPACTTADEAATRGHGA